MKVRFAILAVLTAAVGLVMAAPASSAPVGAAVPADVAPMHANCGTVQEDDDSSKENVVDPARNGAANQRSGSSTSCTILGVLQPTDNADYYCYTVQSGGDYTWTYLRNIRTGVLGWVRDDLLSDNGSYVLCD